MALARMEPYGFFILIALMFTGLLGFLTIPLMTVFLNLIGLFTGLTINQIESLLAILLS